MTQATKGVRTCAAAKVDPDCCPLNAGHFINDKPPRLICKKLINQTFRNCTFAQYVAPVPYRIGVIPAFNFRDAFRRYGCVVMYGEVLIQIPARKPLLPVFVNIVFIYPCLWVAGVQIPKGNRLLCGNLPPACNLDKRYSGICAVKVFVDFRGNPKTIRVAKDAFVCVCLCAAHKNNDFFACSCADK